MTLSVKLRLKRDSDTSDFLLTGATTTLGAGTSDSYKLTGTTPINSRRLTRALARKLQEERPKPIEGREISPVLATTSLESKAEDTDRWQSSSLSPPCLRASIQQNVEQKESARRSDFPAGKTITASLPRLGLVVCSLCGTSAVRMTNIQNSDRFKCERCLAIAATEDKAKFVSRPARRLARHERLIDLDPA